jgi:hypothetical protein
LQLTEEMRRSEHEHWPYVRRALGEHSVDPETSVLVDWGDEEPAMMDTVWIGLIVTEPDSVASFSFHAHEAREGRRDFSYWKAWTDEEMRQQLPPDTNERISCGRKMLKRGLA